MPANSPSPQKAVASAPVRRVALAGGWLVGVIARLSAGTGTRIGNGAFPWLHAVCASAFVAWLCLFGGLAAAQEVLRPAFERFPAEAIIPYNLACYACQAGQLDEARRWLDHAFQRGKPDPIKRMALADPDLRPLWEELKKR